MLPIGQRRRAPRRARRDRRPPRPRRPVRLPAGDAVRPQPDRHQPPPRCRRDHRALRRPAARASTATGCRSSSVCRRCGCTSATAPRRDRYLDLAARDPLRRSGLFDCQVRQRLAMRHLLDGRWDDAAAEIDEARARGAHDPNIRLGCDAQANWLRRERGDVEACYVATDRAGRAAAGARPGAGGAGVRRRRGRPPRGRPSPARPAGRRRLRRRPAASGWP